MIIFSPLGFVGFSLRAWPWGRGSRGKTPLHYAARDGHELVVQRLIEAKAAVDAHGNDGRGLGLRILGGKPSWGNGMFTGGSGWNVDSIHDWSFAIFHFLWNVFCQNFWHWYFVLLFAFPTILFLPTPWVGLSLNPWFHFGNRATCHDMSITIQTVLSFQSVHLT